MNIISSSGMADQTQLIPRNLPKGWRFHPTDEEILLDYLKPRILGDPIFGSDVEDVNISEYNPNVLFGKSNSHSGDKERYFFSRCEYYENSKLRKRRVRDGGYWKSTGDPRPIRLEDSEVIIGTKRSLVYHNPDATEFKQTEYAYTAQLDRPITGDYVICKLKRKPSKKKAASNKLMKVEPDGKKTRPNKKARKGGSSNGNPASASASASASAFEDKNLKDMIANSAYGEGEQRNHMASDLENQYPNMMTAFSTYGKGESSYPEASDFDNQNLCEVTYTSAFNKGATSSLMDSHIGNQNSDQITTVSTHNKGDKGCTTVFDMECLISNKMTDTFLYKTREPSCQRASCVEIQNSYEMATVSSSLNEDETSFLMDTNQNRKTNSLITSDFEIQNPSKKMDISPSLNRKTSSLVTSDFEIQNPGKKMDISASVNSKTSSLDTSDFEIQNPSRKMDISASVEGKWSPLTEMHSDFDNQNQYQKTDVSFLEDNPSLSVASKVGETTFQEVQSQYKKTDMPHLEEYPGPLKASDIGETTFEEVQSHYKKTYLPDREDNLDLLIASDIGEDATYPVVDPQQLEAMIASLNSALQEPIHTNESPDLIGFATQSHYEKTDIPTLANHQGPFAASDVGVSPIPALDAQELEEQLAFFY